MQGLSQIYAHGGTFEVKKGGDYRMFLQNYMLRNVKHAHRKHIPSYMSLHARE